MSMEKRVGFCCKWIDHDGQINGIPEGAAARALSTRGTTLTWMNANKAKHQADIKLKSIVEHNLKSVELLVERVGQREPIYRMVRIGSDVLPFYTVPEWRSFYHKPGIVRILEDGFERIGKLARQYGVRLSFHPGEFTVLASHRPDVVRRSIDEMEYHGDMIHMMGYGRDFQDIKMNVHIAGQLGAQGIIDVIPHLTPIVQNTMTIENSETNWGIEESLKLVDHCALVLDIHHHWVKTGEFIQPDDTRVSRVIDSWRGARRPVIHFSSPREDVLVDHDPNVLPDHATLLAMDGINRTKLRAHSDYYWNNALNEWAWSFSDQFDIQCESKAKNLSQTKFVESLLIPTGA